MALRASEKLSDSSLVARKAGDLEAALYASPAYLSRWGSPTEPADLDQHRCVLFRPEHAEAAWTLQGPEGVTERRVRGRIGVTIFPSCAERRSRARVSRCCRS